MSIERLLQELAPSGPLEVVAVVLALVYLILAARVSLWCWPAAFVSSAIYLWLFFERGLYHTAALQVFYVGMAVYGYMQWRGGSRNDLRPIVTWPTRKHVIVACAVTALTLVTGFLEDRFTSAPLPYLDAFTTWGAVITTWMVARKVLENWLYWLVVDGAAIYLYLEIGYAWTACLFVLYIGIVIAGYFAWRRQMVREPAGAPA